MPMTVEYRNGVQSSTISYSNMVIPEGITNEGRYMLVVYTLGRIFNTHKSEYFLYQIKTEIIYFVPRG